MSTSAERGGQQTQTSGFHPQLQHLNVVDPSSGASTASINNPFLRASVPLQPMQIQRNPTSGFMATTSTVGTRDSTPATLAGAAVLKTSNNSNSGRDFYTPHHLPNFSSGIHLNESHLSSAASRYLSSNAVGQHASTAAAAAVAAQTQTQFQRLKVEDALSYLDQVKLQFGSKPHVYNDFLDIMKEFKSQAIDTPGVIQRVSHLFRGHPNLIVGFNTFLPPGYKIEVHGDCGERVSISTPSGQSHIIAPEEPLPPLPNHANQANTNSAAANNDNRSVIVNGQSKPVASVQPLEFNHAISYVNKIKMRFINQPEVYKNFLEILHTYQKEQREIKDGLIPFGRRTLSEREVYDMVARLFANEEDLLREFSQFLPDATAPYGLIPVQQAAQRQTPTLSGIAATTTVASALPASSQPTACAASTLSNFTSLLTSPSSSVYLTSPNRPAYIEPSKTPPKSLHVNTTVSPRTDVSVIKRTIKESPKEAINSSPPKKMPRREVTNGDMDLPETINFGSLHEYEYFDKVRKLLRDEDTYRNFLRLLVLYNQEVLSKCDLMQLLIPLFGKHVDLIKWFREFLGCTEMASSDASDNVLEKAEERIISDLALEIDYHSCIRHGVSYRALPKSYVHPKSSGRTALCDEVLNNTWVSFPSMISEDSTFVSSKKSQYEENIYRTEDERFELDNVIETNNATIETFESLMKHLKEMDQEEAKRFQLDEYLFSRSRTLHQRAIRRLYGETSRDVINGLMKNPLIVVPIVLERLKEKDHEWRDARKSFNRVWREQNEKHYWKSLDHQGLNFKQNDFKLIRSKALLNQIETLFDERRELIEEGVSPTPTGPHLQIEYPKERSVFYDINDLLIHHVKRQAGLQKDEKYKIKKFLKVSLPQIFGIQCETLSDDENESEDKEDDERSSANDNNGLSTHQRNNSRNMVKRKKNGVFSDNNNIRTASACSDHQDNGQGKCLSIGFSRKNDFNKINYGYSLMMVTNPLYIFLRLHQLLSERLTRLRSYCYEQLANEKLNSLDESRAAADLLKCRPTGLCPTKEYYPTLIQLIKNMLDGQIDSVQFEDSLRDMFLIQAYVAFTMDKIVQTMVKQMHVMVTDEVAIKANELYDKYRVAGGAVSYGSCSLAERKVLEEQYQREAERFATDQNLFKTVFMHDEQKVTFELLDTDLEEKEEDENGSEDAEIKPCSAYMREFTSESSSQESSSNSDAQFRSILDVLVAKPVFLCRNTRKMKNYLNEKLNSRKSSAVVRNESLADAADENGASTSLVIDDGIEPTTSADTKDNTDAHAQDKSPIVEKVHEQPMPVTKTRLNILYVPRPNDAFYRKGALIRAQKSRLKLTETRNRHFGSWHERWTLANVSMESARVTDDWFMGRSEDMVLDSSVWIQRIQESCTTRPPFLTLYRYLSPQSQNASMIGLSQIVR